MPPWRLDMAVTEEGSFAAIAAAEDEIDVTVALPADSPLRALGGIDRIMAAAHVTGNAEFATELSFVLRNLRWDAEEDLSRLVGDVAAHRVTGLVSRFVSWQKESVRNTGENLAEYLGEEARLLVPRHELAAFSREVAELDERIAGMVRRLDRIA